MRAIKTFNQRAAHAFRVRRVGWQERYLSAPRIVLRTGIALFLLVSPVFSQTIPALLTFEGPSAGDPIFDQYSGIKFLGGDLSLVTVVRPPLGTISGVNALQFLCVGVNCQEFSGSQLIAQFSVGQHRIKASIGLVHGFSGGNLAAIMRGYSDLNRSVLVAESAPVLLGSAPTTIDNPIEITSSTGAILSMTLTLVLFSNPSVSPDGVPVVVDNVAYDEPIATPPPDTTLPDVRIIRPSVGQSIEGQTPGLLTTRLEAAVDEEALRSVSLSLNSRPAVAIPYTLTSPGEYAVRLDLLASDGLVAGFNSLTLTATDFAGNVATASTQFQFIPRPVPPPSVVDIIGVAIEATQSI